MVETTELFVFIFDIYSLLVGPDFFVSKDEKCRVIASSYEEAIEYVLRWYRDFMDFYGKNPRAQSLLKGIDLDDVSVYEKNLRRAEWEISDIPEDLIGSCKNKYPIIIFGIGPPELPVLHNVPK